MSILSSKAILTIAAVAYVAANQHEGAVPAKVINAHLNLPPRYLEVVLQALQRAGILKSWRGPIGGYKLGSAARLITLNSIVEVVAATSTAEEPKFGEAAAHIDKTISTLAEPFREALKGWSIADLNVPNKMAAA